MAKITLNAPKLDRLIQKYDEVDVKKYFGRAMREATKTAIKYTREQTPKRTGKLARSIRISTLSVRRSVIEPHVKYAKWVHDETDKHAIPNAFGFGDDFGTESDFHPGTEGIPFMTRGAEAAREPVQQEFDDQIELMFDQLSV